MMKSVSFADPVTFHLLLPADLYISVDYLLIFDILTCRQQVKNVVTVVVVLVMVVTAEIL